ncbi:MAG: 30S ribosomal protein S12 methylthiotransferase RimO [Desulforhabdus sp.]|jgi:ribosomal protein S12 methylthiotransferase|nr:30S ribosomal protein S12 methylthiotransferase RimO [Desulforhabdus sp.]
MKRYASIVTFGCAKNLVDSETLAPQLIRCGFKLSLEPSEASLILINTCGFLESAVQESIDAILQLAALKTHSVCEELVVVGCMVQRYGKKLLDLLPEVDLFLGTSHYLELAAILKKRQKGNGDRLWMSTPKALPTSQTPRLRSTPPHTAYLKIAEGCSNRCSFCRIPSLRGPYRSRSVEDVLHEVRRLVSEGVKELNLIAQDSTAFGMDRGDHSALLRLLESLDDLPALEWVRLLYAYPDRITPDLLNTIARSKKVVHYLDIPLQHCVPAILRRMRRGASDLGVRPVIDMIRTIIPDIALRTSLMVGFPGETEADFNALLDFVEMIQFDHIGVFSYSAEEGTQAARLPMQIDAHVKEARRQVLLDLQKNISRRRLKNLVGRNLPVLVEGLHPETDLLLAGRLAIQAPEVDGSVIITKGTARMGTIVPATITRVHDYDVEAELLPGCRNDDIQKSPQVFTATGAKRFDI